MHGGSMPSQLANLAGIALILLLAVGLSTARRRIRLRVVGAAFALQLAIAFAVLRTDAGHLVIGQLAGGVGALLTCADKGTEFLFGPPDRNPFVNSFALGALPVIIFFASLVSLLYHLGVMQRIIRWIGGAIGLITG
ncbi:MAG TPA: Na+ dependent nucleoside transporter N-terminal domain-containing protein, partial [Myxococcales bacterium]